MINPTITASKTAIITKSCVWLGEADVMFFTESAGPMFVGLRVGIELCEPVVTGEGVIEGLGFELCACTFRTVKDGETNIAAKKTAAKNKILLFTLCTSIISLILHN
jgi:hypothetical protein